MNKKLLFNNIKIRPTIKIQDKANKILQFELSIELKRISIRQAWTEEFKEYMKSIDKNRKQDISKFYNIINSLIQYKCRGKIVKGIKQEDLII